MPERASSTLYVLSDRAVIFVSYDIQLLTCTLVLLFAQH